MLMFLLQLAGLALIIIGVMYKINFSEGIKALPADVGVAPTLSIIVGSIVFITAFLGCCGAVRESTCMLTTVSLCKIHQHPRNLLNYFNLPVCHCTFDDLHPANRHRRVCFLAN